MISRLSETAILKPPFAFSELAECAAREVRMRQNVYPNRVMTGRMTQKQATRELQMMDEIARYLRALAERERLL